MFLLFHCEPRSLTMWEEKYGESKLSPAYGGTFSSRFSFWSDESSDPTPGNVESMTRGRIRQATERKTTDLPSTSRPKLKPVVSDTMKEMNRRLDFLIEKYDRMERFDKEEKGVRLNFSSISNCLPDNGSRLEVVGNNTAKYHLWWICSFEETLASVSERWGVASSSAEFPLSSLDGYSSGDDDSSDPSSGNDEPMTLGMKVGSGERKTRGRVRRKKAKKCARPRPRPPLNGLHLSIKSVKRPINKLRGRRKRMAAHHYRLKPGEGSTVPHWLKKKQPRFRVFYNLGPKYRQKSRKKVMVAQQYWLKPGEDMTCPLWLKHQPKYTHSHASFDLRWPKDPSISVANS